MAASAEGVKAQLLGRQEQHQQGRPSAPCTPRVKAELLCRAERESSHSTQTQSPRAAARPFSIFVQVPHLSLLSVLNCSRVTCVLGSCVTSFHLLLSYATLLFIYLPSQSVHRALRGRLLRAGSPYPLATARSKVYRKSAPAAGWGTTASPPAWVRPPGPRAPPEQ